MEKVSAALVVSAFVTPEFAENLTTHIRHFYRCEGDSE